MSRNYGRLVRIGFLLGDIIALNASFIIAYLIRFSTWKGIDKPPYLIIWACFNALWIGISLIAKTYRVSRLENYIGIAKKVLRAIAWHFALIAVFLVFTQVQNYSRIQLITSYSIFSAFILIWRIIIITSLSIYRRLGYNALNVVIAGYDKAGLELYQFFKNNPEKGYRFMGFFDNRPLTDPLVKGKIEDLAQYAISNNVHEIFCSLDKLTREQLHYLNQFADHHLRRVKLLPNLKDFTVAEIAVEQYGHIPVVLSRREPLNDAFNQIAKRTFDIIFSLGVILFVFSWLFPLLALIIRLDSKGPIFFRQKRAGKNNKVFWCFKFRTMAYQKNATFSQATKNDKRITKIGKILRKTSIDELPQFFNVLMGDMTVVGPRPHPLELNETFKNVVEKYMVRHLVKPGVTGLAQVRGYRGETKDVRSMINRVKMDVFYIENWSFTLDLKIIAWTLKSMVQGDKNAF